MSWQTMIESDDKTEPESQRSIPAIKYVPFQLYRMQKAYRKPYEIFKIIQLCSKSEIICFNYLVFTDFIWPYTGFVFREQ